MKEQYSFREISLLNGTTTDKAGELAYHAAVDRLAAQLIEDEVIRIVDMKLKKWYAEKIKTPPQLTCIRQTATANGVRSILILRLGI